MTDPLSHKAQELTLVHSLKMDIGTPNCDALYQVVKVEAEPETVFQEVPCRHRKAHELPALMHSLGGLWGTGGLRGAFSI